MAQHTYITLYDIVLDLEGVQKPFGSHFLMNKGIINHFSVLYDKSPKLLQFVAEYMSFCSNIRHDRNRA